MGPYLEKFPRFGKYLAIFVLFKVYLVLEKVFNALKHNLHAFGQIFIAVNGQILKTQSDHLVTLFASKPPASLYHPRGQRFKAMMRCLETGLVIGSGKRSEIRFIGVDAAWQ